MAKANRGDELVENLGQLIPECMVQRLFTLRRRCPMSLQSLINTSNLICAESVHSRPLTHWAILG